MITDGLCRHCGAAILFLLLLFASTLSVVVTVDVPVVILAVESVHRKEEADGNKEEESLLLRSSKGRNDCGIDAAVLLLLALAYLDLPLSGAAA